ncbi:MAG: 50S ribosomal protein L10 [Paludibacteraceae bacterium]|nr:50S ribosomal protein L10 [Paludibacteraceae bacterium]
MKKEDKAALISTLKETISSYSHFYITDASGLNAEQTFKLRQNCFKSDIKLMVVKNTLFQKALEELECDYSSLFDTLKGSTAIMFCNNGNAPARLIKDMKKTLNDKPELKAAYVQECFYIGANQLDTLIALKSKEELLGEIIGMLQSPMQNVLSALQSGGNTIHGVLKTLGERAE